MGLKGAWVVRGRSLGRRVGVREENHVGPGDARVISLGPQRAAMEDFRKSQSRGRKALEKEREMRRTGGYPAHQTLQSLGVFSEPSSCGVGTPGAPAEYDGTWKTRTQGEIFCQSTTRRTGRQVLSDIEASVSGASYSPRKFFG